MPVRPVLSTVDMPASSTTSKWVAFADSYGIRWQDKMLDEHALEHANTPSDATLLQREKVSWAGNVVGTSDRGLPKPLLSGALCQGNWTVGGQRKRYRDNLKAPVKDKSIDVHSRETHALDRPNWHSKITIGARVAEKHRRAEPHRKACLQQDKNRLLFNHIILALYVDEPSEHGLYSPVIFGPTDHQPSMEL